MINVFYSGNETADFIKNWLNEENSKQQELSMGENFFRSLIENSGDIVFSLDTGLRIMYVSPSCLSVLGYTAYEMLNLPVEELHPSKDKLHWMRLLKGAFFCFSKTGRKTFLFKASVINKHGNIIFLEIRLSLMLNSSNEIYGIQGIARDITSQKKYEERNKAYIRKLKDHNSAKDKFFSIIANDLKNPLVSLLGFTEMLITEYENLTDNERMVYINELRKSTNHAYELLYNLLIWSRARVDRIDCQPVELCLCDLIESNTSMMKNVIAEKNISIINNVDRKLFVHADKFMLKTVIRDLINNAIKYINRDGEIVINAKGAGRYVEVSISDNGYGMDEQVQKNIFNIGDNVSFLNADKESSNGLRLVLCKEFITRNNGSIGVKSEIGKGTVFTFTVPRF